jgi:hypothetical protein
MPVGLFNPESRSELTVAPEVVYSPTVPVEKFVTKTSVPDTAMYLGVLKPNPEISAGFTVAPEVVYSPTVAGAALFTTNSFEPDRAMPDGKPNPEISAGFTVVPEVVYSPIVPEPALVTKSRSALAASIESPPMRTANRPLSPCLNTRSIVLSHS